MLTIATTRFNNKTWKENVNWREKNKYTGCIYGTPVQIRELFVSNTNIIILEMNNDTNKIIGIGLIKNRLFFDKYYKIYSEQNYNRYTYKGQNRISRESLTEKQEKVIKILDIILFKGKNHLKRGHGITTLPYSLIKNKKNWNIIIKFFKGLFIHHYSYQID